MQQQKEKLIFFEGFSTPKKGYLYFDAGAKNAFRVTRDFNLIPPYVGKKTRLGGRENTPLCSYFHAPAGNDTGGFLPPCPSTKGYFHACFKSAGFYLACFYPCAMYKKVIFTPRPGFESNHGGGMIFFFEEPKDTQIGNFVCGQLMQPFPKRSFLHVSNAT